MKLRILTGDWIEQLRTLPEQSVHCCVTSPPYWGLRDYGVPGQLGLEKTPEEYVAKLVAGFREVRRVLRDDGTLWVNLGDTYASQGGSFDPAHWDNKQSTNRGSSERVRKPPTGLKPKDLVGIPWRVAFALQADGWYLRSDIIWHKPNPMPESVTDRPTKSHEYIFLLSKSERYFYDAEAIKEPASENTNPRISQSEITRIKSLRDGGMNTSAGMGATHKSVIPDGMIKQNHSFENACCLPVSSRNKRTVWTVATSPYKEAHFATFPPDLIKPCILAGCPVGGIVLDPFFGSGTTGQVALELGRKCLGIELNPKYVELAEQRCSITPGLSLM